MIFQRGQDVAIPCEIKRGALVDEFLVTIETEEGVLSGFANKSDLRFNSRDPSTGHIRATVVDVGSNLIKVKIYASFFTIASGTTIVSSSWANSNLQEVTA